MKGKPFVIDSGELFLFIYTQLVIGNSSIDMEFTILLKLATMESVIFVNGCNSVRPTCEDVSLIAAEGCVLSSYKGGSEEIWGGNFKEREGEHGAARGVEV